VRRSSIVSSSSHALADAVGTAAAALVSICPPSTRRSQLLWPCALQSPCEKHSERFPLHDAEMSLLAAPIKVQGKAKESREIPVRRGAAMLRPCSVTIQILEKPPQSKSRALGLTALEPLGVRVLHLFDNSLSALVEVSPTL